MTLPQEYNIKMLDKINNQSWCYDQYQEVVIHPKGQVIVLEHYRRKDMFISGIIFHQDGSTEVLSKRYPKK